MLDDVLRSLFLSRSEKMGCGAAPNYAGLSHHITLKHTGDSKLAGAQPRETGVLENLTYHVPAPESTVHECVEKLIDQMSEAHNALWAKQ